MAGANIYFIMSEDEYLNLILENKEYELVKYLPAVHILYEEADFGKYFGNDGYVSEGIFDIDEIKDMSEELFYTLNLPSITYVNNRFSIEEGFKMAFAEKKLYQIKKVVNNMTPGKFMENGEYLIREAVRDEDILVHPVGDLPGDYVQTMDGWLYNYAEQGKTYYIVAVYYGHY